jgi:EmrB/QacA subfamily drug resistance transporter
METKIKFDKNLLTIVTTSFLVPFMGSALNLALPQISEDFQMKAVTLTLIASSYLIATTIFQIPFSKIADLFGRKKIFFLGIAVFSLATILCGFAPNSEILIALRFISGLGSAMTGGTGMAILTSLYPANQRGKILGINTSVVYAALAAGPLLGGLLTHEFGWQSLFFVTGIVGFFVLLLGKLFLKGEWIEAKGEIFDVFGSIIYGIGLLGLIYGFSNLPKLTGIICLIIGIISSVFFVFYENRQIYPVLNIKLFKGNRVFSLSCLAALINYMATSAIGFLLSLYLQYIRGYDASHAGLILISQACIQSIFSLLSGRFSDKIHPSKLATTGMIIIVAGLFGLIFLSAETPIWFIICLLLLLGIGFGIFSSPNTNVIMSSVSQKNYGQASATTGTARMIGMTFSLGIAGMAMSFKLGDNAIVPELYPAFLESMRTTFIICLFLCLIGIYASTARIEKK